MLSGAFTSGLPGKGEIGKGEMWHNKVCQFMPWYLKIRGHFPGVIVSTHWPCARAICYTGTMTATIHLAWKRVVFVR